MIRRTSLLVLLGTVALAIGLGALAAGGFSALLEGLVLLFVEMVIRLARLVFRF